MPWGKYKGVRIQHLPDDYLSWLMTTKMMLDKKWRWLLDSLMAEVKHRGLKFDLTPDPEPIEESGKHPKRGIRL